MDANKRTGALATTMFMDLNGYELRYPLSVDSGVTAFANIVEKVAASKISKNELTEWFDSHKKEKI